VDEAMHGLQQHPFQAGPDLVGQLAGGFRQLVPGDVFRTAAHAVQRSGR
jgi:hypothetical protein